MSLVGVVGRRVSEKNDIPRRWSWLPARFRSEAGRRLRGEERPMRENSEDKARSLRETK